MLDYDDTQVTWREYLAVVAMFLVFFLPVLIGEILLEKFGIIEPHTGWKIGKHTARMNALPGGDKVHRPGASPSIQNIEVFAVLPATS